MEQVWRFPEQCSVTRAKYLRTINDNLDMSVVSPMKLYLQIQAVHLSNTKMSGKSKKKKMMMMVTMTPVLVSS